MFKRFKKFKKQGFALNDGKLYSYGWDKYNMHFDRLPYLAY